jgi:MerR family transcriptional regulator, light-induced transcriptional regulator
MTSTAEVFSLLLLKRIANGPLLAGHFLDIHQGITIHLRASFNMQAYRCIRCTTYGHGMKHEGRGKGQDLLSLAEVLSISGLTKLVLHAWERRYGLQPEQRSDTGRRFYTVEQAERLRLLRVCSEGGQRIGNLIALPLEDLKRIEAAQSARLRNAPLIEALQALNGEDARAMLQARADAEGAEGFVDATAIPLLQQIGQLWAEGAMSVAAEHLASAKIRRVLGAMIDQGPEPTDDAPRMITATLEGEEHEIGALASTLIARLHGLNSLHLGTNLPQHEILAAARMRNVHYVCLSALVGKRSRLEADLRALRAALPKEILLVTGGPGYASMPALEGVVYIPHFDAFRSLIETKR